MLNQSGVVVPDDLDPDDENIPLDFTRLGNRAIGGLHSRFSVRHAHILYVRAQNATEILRLRRRHRLGVAEFRVRHGDEHRTDKSLLSAFGRSKRGKKLEEALDELEIMATLLDAVAEGYLDVVKASSREMARRDSERTPRD